MTQHNTHSLAAALTFEVPFKKCNRRYLRDVSGLSDEEVHALFVAREAREWAVELARELRLKR